MKILLGLLLLAVLCYVTNGFLFHKFKNGCDPNPCKHKTTCVLDKKNANLSTCDCAVSTDKSYVPNSYTGKVCDLKRVCIYDKKACVKGTCKESMDEHGYYTHHHCECIKGFAGDKCEKDDLCMKKNPCKNGSVCSLDDHYKPICACPLGMGSKACDKRNCTIVALDKVKNFASKPTVYIDASPEIVQKFHKFDEMAKVCGVKIQPIRSFSLQPDPKLPADSKNAPFYIGRGLEFEVLNATTGHLICNAVCLGKVPIPIAGAKCLIDALQAIQLKWSILNPSVVHDGFYISNAHRYNSLKEMKQVGCKETKMKP